MHVIEFLGMPRSGKTTQIKLLEKFLLKRGYSVKIISDRHRASNIKTPPTETTGYKLVFFSQAIEEYFNNKEQCDYLIVDRGFNDSLIWFDVEKILGHILPKRAEQIKLTFKEYLPLVHQIFCLMTQPSIAIKRHKKSTHQAIDDVAMNKKYLAALNRSYKQNIKQFKNCTVINKNGSPQDLHKKIIKKIPLI